MSTPDPHMVIFFLSGILRKTDYLKLNINFIGRKLLIGEGKKKKKNQTFISNKFSC